MNRRNSVIISLLLSVVLIQSVFCLEPIPKTLTQQKLDKFMADYKVIIGNDKITTAWGTCFQNVLLDEVMNPNTELVMDDTLNSVYTLFVKARIKIKQDKETTSILKKYNWNEEFWDVYVIVAICNHYNTVIEENKELNKIKDETNGEDDGVQKLPDLSRFVNTKDYELFNANYERLKKVIEKDSLMSSGF